VYVRGGRRGRSEGTKEGQDRIEAYEGYKEGKDVKEGM
jgi:hypothetical protein